MELIKFRTPYRCQNGHPRFGFTTIRPDGYAKLEWGTANCDCPTADIGQGFRVVGEHELFTGVKDANGVEIYENDIVLGFGIVEWYCDRREGYNGWTFLDLEKGHRHDFWYLTSDLRVVDYAPQSELLEDAPLGCDKCSHIFPDGKEVHFEGCSVLGKATYWGL